jgi:poly(A) polymerase
VPIWQNGYYTQLAIALPSLITAQTPRRQNFRNPSFLTAPTTSLEAPNPLARVIPRDAHTVSRNQISPNALRVLYRLKESGYQAFLVGGCVRDLLLGLEPKDFDVATDALPEDVRRLFRNCRLIGRRFRLAHVFFGQEIIEVATFRAGNAPPPGDEVIDENMDDAAAEYLPPGSAAADGSRVVDAAGRILRDNTYGTIDDDVWRRDFTANALYYNIADFSIWDYVGGFEDVAARRLKLIGDPETRFREDPVRMLRAARFVAKLGFELDPATLEAMSGLQSLLSNVPPARLFDETLKLFLTGHGVASLAVLSRFGLLAALLPSVYSILTRAAGSPLERLLQIALANSDARVQAGKPVTPTFLFAVLMYGPIGAVIEKSPPQRWHEVGTIVDAVDRVFRELVRTVAVPRRFSLGVREMFAFQPRLEQPRGRRALRLLEQARFRAAYDLLLLRADAGLAPREIADWWTRLQAAAPEERETMVDGLGRGGGPPRVESSASGDETSSEEGPRRRRRRGGRGRRQRAPEA